MEARHVPNWRTVPRQSTRRIISEVTVNKHSHLRDDSHARQCAGERWPLVSAKCNATLFWFHSVASSMAGTLLPARWPGFPVDYVPVCFPFPCSFPVRASSTPDVSGRTVSGGTSKRNESCVSGGILRRTLPSVMTRIHSPVSRGSAPAPVRIPKSGFLCENPPSPGCRH